MPEAFRISCRKRLVKRRFLHFETLKHTLSWMPVAACVDSHGDNHVLRDTTEVKCPPGAAEAARQEPSPTAPPRLSLHLNPRHTAQPGVTLPGHGAGDSVWAVPCSLRVSWSAETAGRSGNQRAEKNHTVSLLDPASVTGFCHRSAGRGSGHEAL